MTHYIVRNADTEIDRPTLKWDKKQSNSFQTLQDAMDSAMQWCKLHEHTYVVYEVKEIGKAERQEPPVRWVPNEME